MKHKHKYNNEYIRAQRIYSQEASYYTLAEYQSFADIPEWMPMQGEVLIPIPHHDNLSEVIIPTDVICRDPDDELGDGLVYVLQVGEGKFLTQTEAQRERAISLKQDGEQWLPLKQMEHITYDAVRKVFVTA